MRKYVVLPRIPIGPARYDWCVGYDDERLVRTFYCGFTAEWQARQMANALNTAYQAGIDDIKSGKVIV